MKISQTRLDERTRRLCVEVCFDEPMKGSVCLSVCVSVSVCLLFSLDGSTMTLHLCLQALFQLLPYALCCQPRSTQPSIPPG